jgi:polyphenol oxidase
LGQPRDYGSDPDFLNAEFLFYDENQDIRRVKVQNALNTTILGYVYQETNNEPWITLAPPR